MASIVPYTTGSASINPVVDWFNALNDAFGMPTAEIAPATMQMDVEDEPTAYHVSVTVPGVKRDQIDVELNNGNLMVTVDKKDSDEDKKKNYVRRETSEFHATRSVYLKGADPKGVTASMNDGVLTINVPKQQEAAGAKIEIQ
ncbi:Hsp20/alpha crystallin family protein [bacterium]|nr:Hsp20/alpha crystallin family protein [bacterium]